MSPLDQMQDFFYNITHVISVFHQTWQYLWKKSFFTLSWVLFSMFLYSSLFGSFKASVNSSFPNDKSAAKEAVNKKYYTYSGSIWTCSQMTLILKLTLYWGRAVLANLFGTLTDKFLPGPWSALLGIPHHVYLPSLLKWKSPNHNTIVWQNFFIICFITYIALLVQLLLFLILRLNYLKKNLQ